MTNPTKIEKMFLSEKQIEFLKNGNRRFNGKIGATRCGKTFLDISVLIPMRILERIGKQGINIILGVSKGTIERNILEPMRKYHGKHMVSNINSQNKAILFGEVVYCIGAEKISQVSKLRGAEFKYCYCDELVEFHEEVFQILKSRLSTNFSVCDFTGNPSHPTNFVKKFIDSEADIYCQNWTIYDNPFLPNDFVKNLEIEYANTVYFDRYILGMWKKAEGLIFPNFEKAVIAPKNEKYTNFVISIDYGIQNAFGMLLFGKCANDNWHAIKEYYHSGRDSREQKTDNEYYEDLKKFAKGYNIDRVIIDPSAASFITLIKKSSTFFVKKAKNDVLSGIARVAVSMSKNNLKIFDNCKNLIDELGQYSWDQKVFEDKPLKKNDHLCDALRYFVYTQNIAYRKCESIKMTKN